MIAAGTGHRPQHLGQGNPSRIEDRLHDLASAVLKKLKPEKVISGMALGWDLALAQAAIWQGIPLIAAVPFVGQESRWQPAQKDQYHFLLRLAESKVVVTEQRPVEMFEVAIAMQKRNVWMVDNCDLLVALFNGEPGGTANCVKYSTKIDRKIFNCWGSWAKFNGVCNPE